MKLTRDNIHGVSEEVKDAMLEEQERADSAQAKGLCPECGRVALEHCYTEAGKKEVAISGLCEECFDAMFEEEEEDDREDEE